jgi:branched-chain amino acid aminotransferase
MQKSTERICIPAMNHQYFMNAVTSTVLDNLDFVPPYGKGTMYIRPISFGISQAISVQPASEYLFIVFASPVGPYFKGGSKVLHLYLSDEFHRAAPKGIGNAKAIGNYSASLLPGSKAKSKGFNDMIYVHAKNERLIEEMGAANLFIFSDGELLTPKLGGSILDGVTRDSVITIAEEMLNLKVKETDIEIERLLQAEEVFCCGTAVEVTSVGKVSTKDKDYTIGNGAYGPKSLLIKKHLLQIQKEEIDDPFGWIHPIN